jgi:hypothetical protein
MVTLCQGLVLMPKAEAVTHDDPKEKLFLQYQAFFYKMLERCSQSEAAFQEVMLF